MNTIHTLFDFLNHISLFGTGLATVIRAAGIQGQADIFSTQL